MSVIKHQQNSEQQGQLSDEQLETVTGGVDFDQLRRDNLDKGAVDFDQLRRDNLEKGAVSYPVQ